MVCAPGRGTSASYPVTSSAYGIATARAAAARAKLLTGEQALWEKSQDAAARLKAADETYQRGDIRPAARLYVRLAASRPPTESSKAARERLKTLAADARAKLAEIDAILNDSESQPSPSDLFYRGDHKVDGRFAAWEAAVRAAFNKYNRLVDDYEGVPNLANTLTSHVNRQRRRMEIAVVLNEPEAKALLDAGKQHESEDHQCCAYWVYRQAARLAPAPSAIEAKTRLEALEEVPDIVAKAEACREVQRCHQLYARAERLLPDRPERADELFAEVIRRAPSDSKVYRAAEQRLARTAP